MMFFLMIIHDVPEFLYFIHEITSHHERLEVELKVSRIDVIMELSFECVDHAESQLAGLVTELTQAVMEQEVVSVATVT